MNIAYDAKRYFNNATGLGFYSRTLLEGLRRYYPEHHYLLYTPYNRGKWASKQDEIRLPDTWFGQKFHPIWRSSGMVRQLKQDQTTIFHGLSHELPIGLRQAGIRSVVTMHDLIFMRFPELYPATDRFFYEKKYRRAAQDADCIVAISEQTRADLEHFFQIPAQKIKVIGQSCDAEFERLSLRSIPDKQALPLPDGLNLPASDYLICVGSLSPRKNWGHLLMALAILKDQGTDLPLVAVGTGKSAYALDLRKQAAANGLRVYWVDQHISITDLALLYRRAAVMAYPSVFEGFGIPILEALTIGLPVVTTSGGCFEEVGGNAALYAPADDPARIAAQILRALNTQVQTELQSKIANQIEAFSPEKISAAWMKVYLELAGRH